MQMSAGVDFRALAKPEHLTVKTTSTDLPEMEQHTQDFGSSDTEAEDGIISEDEAPPMSGRCLGPPTPKRMGHVEIQRAELEYGKTIGTGVTADVYKGVWKGELVAIKQIKGDSRIAMKLQTAFTRELAVLSKCHHPNLCCFRGACLEAAPLCLVTEFCAGGTLFNLLHGNDVMDISWTQNLKMCTDIAKGMNYLHTSKPSVIHRDLKSLNLLLLRPFASEADIPMVKVADFGTARIKEDLDADWGGVKMTQNSGTCHWMAPEVHSGKYCEKADVYSFAMVLFEILCREIPFEDKKAHQVALLTVSGGRPDLEAVPPDCPPGLQRLMIRCWDQAPEVRLSFAEILEALAKFGTRSL